MDFCAGDTVATVDATVLAEVLDVQPIPMKGLPAGIVCHNIHAT